jgi:uncharacterized GH25 family protein
MFRFLISLIFTFGSAFSHDYWLHPEKFTISSGETLVVHLFVGDGFVSELERPLQKFITKRFELITKDRVVDLLDELPDSVKPVLKRKVNFDGLALIAMERDFAYIELPDSIFSEYLKHEELLDIEKLREKIGRRKVERERYARFIKSLVKIGDGVDGDVYKKIIGHKLEIVPLQNPYELGPGDEIEVMILFDGKPLKDKVVMAYNRYDSNKIGRFRSRTDSAGIARFKLEGGIWLIRLVHLIPCYDCKEVNWESFWASFTFEISGSNRENDMEGMSIHELEHRTHKFDMMKIDPSIPEMLEAKKLAQEGKLEDAEREMKKAIYKNKAYAYFNLGIIYLYQDKLEKSLEYFRNSYELEPDPICLEQIKNVKRLIEVRKKMKLKK